jgi:hypothetical protein
MSIPSRKRKRAYIWYWKDNAGEVWISFGSKEPSVDERGWCNSRFASRLAIWGDPRRALPEHVLLRALLAGVRRTPKHGYLQRVQE